MIEILDKVLQTLLIGIAMGCLAVLAWIVFKNLWDEYRTRRRSLGTRLRGDVARSQRNAGQAVSKEIKTSQRAIKTKMKSTIGMVVWLALSGVGLAGDRFYVISPVVHDFDAGVYTGFALTNSNLETAGNSIDFEVTTATIVFWDERGRATAAYRWAWGYTETLFIQTGDLLKRPFKGCATVNASGRVTGCVYVLVKGDHFSAAIEEVP